MTTKKLDKKKLEIILTIGEEKYHRRRGKYRDQSWLLLFHRTKVWRNWIEIDIKIVDRDLTRFYRILNWADFKEDETRRSRSLPDSCSAERSREPCPSRPLSRINVTRVRLKPGFNCAPTKKLVYPLDPPLDRFIGRNWKDVTRFHTVFYGTPRKPVSLLPLSEINVSMTIQINQFFLFLLSPNTFSIPVLLWKNSSRPSEIFHQKRS